MPLRRADVDELHPPPPNGGSWWEQYATCVYLHPLCGLGRALMALVELRALDHLARRGVDGEEKQMAWCSWGCSAAAGAEGDSAGAAQLPMVAVV